MRACVSVSAIELTCDVTIAVRSPRGRTVARLACLLLHTPIHSVSWCWSINSSQASLLPRSVPVGPAHALVALRLRRPFIGLARSFMRQISCSVVLRAFASLLYFRVSFVFEFSQWI